MKRNNILVLIAAAALLSSLCGIFFYPGDYASAPVNSDTTLKAPAFSLEQAKEGINLCSLSYDSEALTAELQSKGYQNCRYYEKKQESNVGSGIAFGIGYKNAEGINQLIVVIRGTEKNEWYSNFQIGENTEHSGFSAAADYVINEINSYTDSHSIETEIADIFVTGHSRGGAVANLISKRFVDNNQFSTLCAYTYASPNTTTALDARNKRYQSIYNIQNPEDFICYIPPKAWNYTKYGTIITLPEKGSKNYSQIYQNMEENFFENAQRKHTGYPDGDRDVQRFIDSLEGIAPDVYSYYNKEITLFPTRVTLYEYMQSAAALLSGERTLSNGMILLSGSSSSQLSSITDFLMLGISFEDMAEDTDLMSSAVGSAHSCETYSAWIQILDDEYFAPYFTE